MADVLISRNASEASGVYNASTAASAAVPDFESAPTDGKNIPLVVGAVRLTGDVIWIRTFLNSKNECRAHVAVCFGRNLFGRPIGLMAVTQGGSYIYRRSGGDVVDPPSAVRFYDGTQVAADSKIVDYEGASRTPAFKGYIYAVLENVKIGDFGAEFSDSSTEEAIESGGGTVSIACDNDLEGVNLVYDFEAGMYYGIRNQRTFEATFVRSKDGCRIFDEMPLDTESDPPADEPEPDLKAHYDKVFPMRCIPMVVWPIHAVWSHGFGDVPKYRVAGHALKYPGISFYQYQLGSGWMDGYSGNEYYLVETPSENAPFEFAESYPIPGETSLHCLLRLYDRSNFGRPSTTPGTGNIACQILDLNLVSQTGNPILMTRNAEEVQAQDTSYSGATYAWDGGWDVVGAPEVDEVFYGRADGGIVRLGGVKVNGSTITVFRIEHGPSGMSYPVTVNISLPAGLGYSGVQYKRSNDLILLSATGSLPNTLLSSRIYKIELDGDVSYSTVGPGLRVLNRQQTREYAGFFVLANQDNSLLYSYDSDTDEITEIYSGDPSDDPVVDLARNKVSVPSLTGYTTYATRQVVADNIPLVDVLTDCCAMKGYSPADLVFQNLETYSLKGLLIASTIRLSDLFNRLGALYGFTFVETDQKLKFLKKRTTGGAYSVDAVLSDDDLVMSDRGGESMIRTISRAGANNLLGGMDLEFMNPEKNYENDTVKIRRPAATFDTGASTRVETLSVPITLDATDAYNLLYESFYGLLQKETRAFFILPPWHAEVEPGDCIEVTVDGVVITGIAVRVTMRDDFAQEVELESYLQNGATSVTPPVAAVPEQGEDVYGRYISLEIPLLRVSDVPNSGSVVVYGGISALDTEGWIGADLYRASEQYPNVLTKIAEYNSAPMTVGVAVNILEQPELLFALDETSVLTIEVRYGQASDFVSQTYIQQINGQIYAAYGRTGSWEIISWQTVTENSDGTLNLSGLQRGLFGTQWAFEAVEHEVGDFICILDPVKLVKTTRSWSDLYKTDLYAVVTSSVGLDRSERVPADVSRRSIYPQIANPIAKHVPGASTMEITWDQCSPVPGNWTDSGAVTPMLETVTYIVRIFTEAAGGFVEYFFETTDTSYTWADYGTIIGANVSAEGMYVYIYQHTPSFSYTGDPEDITSAYYAGGVWVVET